ncbi:transcription factor bHLH162-like [Abrus precatorius]|uniref:Transcription factor bHLH162-like n=1 Tax=Abrus precatorius TaxID=3816 RepID=A0A8B8KKW8_ABRPR|nr:transcription factor bHLH162-like [Abrus precatorius]
MDRQQRSQPSSSEGIERRIVEKNRRNHMKNLYSCLNSLLPNYNPMEVIAVPDQIDEAINYIRSLETKVKMIQEKKESLMARKRTLSGCSSSQGSQKSPKIEVHEMGYSLEVILTCGFDNQFIFYEIIRILHDENVEVISANYSMAGDSVLHILHGEIPQSYFQFGATKVSERLKGFANGSLGDVEIDRCRNVGF